MLKMLVVISWSWFKMFRVLKIIIYSSNKYFGFDINWFGYFSLASRGDFLGDPHNESHSNDDNAEVDGGDILGDPHFRTVDSNGDNFEPIIEISSLKFFYFPPDFDVWPRKSNTIYYFSVKSIFPPS